MKRSIRARLAALTKRCANLQHVTETGQSVVPGADVPPSKAKGKQRKNPKPTLVVDNDAGEPPTHEPAIEFTSVADFPLPDFVFERLDHHKYQLPRQLKGKGHYKSGGVMGTSVGFI